MVENRSFFQEMLHSLCLNSHKHSSCIMELYDGMEPILISQGAFGIVYKVQHRNTNEIFAMKIVRRDESQNNGVPAMVLREIALLRELDHPNIVQLKACIIGNGQCSLIFEFVESDLHKVIIQHHDLGFLDPSLAKSFLFQLCCGLAHCHDHEIIHRDLKPLNLLVSANKILKIADFGLARSYHPGHTRRLTREVMTMWYRCPEILLGIPMYGLAADIWSVGCIFAEMLALQPLFPGPHVAEIEQIMLIFSQQGTPNEQTWPGVTRLAYYNPVFPQFSKRPFHPSITDRIEHNGLNLLEGFLTINPQNRITARQALDHPYFTDLSGERILSRPRLLVPFITVL